MGFKSGGSFMVGGSGGSDSQVVAFRASPKERVTVTPPGASGSGGVVIHQSNTYNGIAGHREMVAVVKRGNEELKGQLLTLRRQGKF